MDWTLSLLPALGDAQVSTDLHDWDGVNDYHRAFLGAADVVFVSGTALGERVEDVAREILAAGRPSLVIATLGSSGALLVERGGSAVHIGAAEPPGPVVDTNGAGDAFAAAFLAGRLAGMTPVDGASYAATVAAAACTYDGMEYPPGLLPSLRTREPPFDSFSP